LEQDQLLPLVSVQKTKQHVGMQMVKQKEGGNIILFADWAIGRPYKNYLAYFISKGAIPTLTRTLAKELGDRNNNIRVNCISPGPSMKPDDIPEDVAKAASDATIVKRWGTADNLSKAVIHFIENNFVTGQVLNVDGGRSIYNTDDVEED